MSGISTPSRFPETLFDRNRFATRLGWYFNSLIAFNISIRVDSLTFPLLFRTRETVAIDTPARLATSLILAIHFGLK